MKTTNTLLSQTTKIGIGISFLYTLGVLIAFISKTYALHNLMDINYITVAFGEEAPKIQALIANLMFGEMGYYALCGLILIGSVWIITQISDMKHKVCSMKSLLTSLCLCGLASVYLIILLRGHGFITYL